MKILCIGDSNTNGYDPRSFLGDSYPDGVRWTDRLEGYDVINWGINGITIPDDPSVYTALIRRKEPDLVIVMLGTNDVLQGAGAEQTARRMDRFLDAVSAAGKRILLIAPPVLTSGEFVPDEETITRSAGIAEKYEKLAAQHGCIFADSGNWNVELAFDGVHFTENGHASFAEGLKDELKKIRL